MEIIVLRVVAWFVLVGSIAEIAPALRSWWRFGESMAVPGAIFAAGSATWAILLGFARIAENTERIAGRFAPRSNPASLLDGRNPEDDWINVGGHWVKRGGHEADISTSPSANQSETNSA